jgi:hypothetical protein
VTAPRQMHGAMVALRPAPRARHLFRVSMFGVLPRELREPALWRQAVLFVPIALGLLFTALVALP